MAKLNLTSSTLPTLKMPEKIVSNLVRNFVSEKSHKVCYNIPIMKPSASATARLSQSFRRTLYILTPPRLLISKASHDTTYLLKKRPFKALRGFVSAQACGGFFHIKKETILNIPLSPQQKSDGLRTRRLQLLERGGADDTARKRSI